MLDDVRADDTNVAFVVLATTFLAPVGSGQPALVVTVHLPTDGTEVPTTMAATC